MRTSSPKHCLALSAEHHATTHVGNVVTVEETTDEGQQMTKPDEETSQTAMASLFSTSVGNEAALTQSNCIERDKLVHHVACQFSSSIQGI